MINKNVVPFAGLCAGALLAFAPADVQANLIFENIGGSGVIYDTTDHATFTQNANISGQSFTYAGAQAWAAGLQVPGVTATWELPTPAQFTSLFDQLIAPNPANGFKYGAQITFGSGPNDYASNVQPEYWTSTSGTDFNFYYGYPGSRPNSSLFAVWAVQAVPEPSGVMMGLLTTGLLAGTLCFRRHPARA